MMMKPEAFLPGSGGGFRPAATLPRYDAAMHVPPPAPMPSVTISVKGVLYLSKPFMAALGLRASQAIDLVPPMPGSCYWHLDLRPHAARCIDCSGMAMKHGRGQGARVKGIKLPGTLLSENLTLYLLPGSPYYPNFYPLLPANAFVIP